MIRSFVVAFCAISLAAGCENDVSGPLAGEPELQRSVAEAPPGAAPGSCWGKSVTPAVVETITDQIVLQPAQIDSNGTILSPAIYKTETRQAIVEERRETWFETPCDTVLTPTFIATLQRALQARGLFRGNVNGQMDGRTRAAVRRYQKPQGLDSGILSLDAARQLGLVALEREDAES
ncbi:peptidoglycan-binding domain-containing protein [Roseovarius sp. 2305UL8-3]|uniref:peptidoglycan-binding domain-containing protein n=1 Tax=Roseovarius conchicola TaxID=3121636 RepID=UPI0035279F5F